MCFTGMTEYIQTWKRNGWKSSSGADVKNQEDLKELDALLSGDVNVKWVSSRLFLKPFVRNPWVVKILVNNFFVRGCSFNENAPRPRSRKGLSRREITVPGMAFVTEFELSNYQISSLTYTITVI